jgi:hypothetical protein
MTAIAAENLRLNRNVDDNGSKFPVPSPAREISRQRVKAVYCSHRPS